MSESGQGTERIKAFLSTITLGKPTVCKNMTGYPLFSRMMDDDGFVLLDEAVKTQKFVVTEVSEGEDVRFRGGKVNGFGLVKDGKVVHVAAFSEN